MESSPRQRIALRSSTSSLHGQRDPSRRSQDSPSIWSLTNARPRPSSSGIRLEQTSQRSPTRRDVLIGAGLTAGTLSLPALAMFPSSARADHASSEPMPEKQAAPFKFGSEPPRRPKERLRPHRRRGLALLRRGERHARRCVRAIARRREPAPVGPWVSIHARHCTQQAQGWRQVHWGWLFLPWHRCYLFFLERQLARVITSVFGEDGTKFAVAHSRRAPFGRKPSRV